MTVFGVRYVWRTSLERESNRSNDCKDFHLEKWLKFSPESGPGWLIVCQIARQRFMNYDLHHHCSRSEPKTLTAAPPERSIPYDKNLPIQGSHRRSFLRCRANTQQLKDDNMLYLKARTRFWSRLPYSSSRWTADVHYRATSLLRNRHPVGPYCRPMPRILGGS